MDDATHAALEASIQHWDENIAAERPDMGLISWERCALCLMFTYPCDGCPVMARIGRGDCGGTPYMKARRAMEKWCKRPDDPAAKVAWVAAATAERDFLVSLRPVTP
jgi:hypothetical protein